MTAPAADPRGGEACTCGDFAGTSVRYVDCPVHCPRPAGDRAQPTQELEAKIAGTLAAYGERPWTATKAVLALPAVAALFDAQAAVNRVQALAKSWEDGMRAMGYADGHHDGAAAIRAALDGT